MTTPETQSALRSLRTVSAPVGCDPSCCVPRTDFNPLLKYSILIFVVRCTTRHISGGHAGVKQSTTSSRNMGPTMDTNCNKQNLVHQRVHKIYCTMIRGTDHQVGINTWRRASIGNKARYYLTFNIFLALQNQLHVLIHFDP